MASTAGAQIGASARILDEPAAFGHCATMETVRGDLVTEVLEFDGGRSVTVYVPAQRPEAIVFAGDGATVSYTHLTLPTNREV